MSATTDASSPAPAPTPSGSLASRLSSLVKLGHTVFGLPFALAAAVVADAHAHAAGNAGLTWSRALLIVVAFTLARTAAMAFNRIVDRRIDAANPRTADRELPRGAVSLRAAVALTVATTAAFVAVAFAIGPLAGMLSPLCIVVIFGYSFFKRFSSASHLVLGVALSLSPAGAWVAVTGCLSPWPIPVLLMTAVGTWVAGFDILYSLADEDFDRERGLHSIPVRFGRLGAMVLSGLLHAATVGALVGFHVWAGLSWAHLAGVIVMSSLLAYEHWIVRPNDLSRLDKAFFDLNGYAALSYLVAVVVDVWVLAG